mmetsp:Transcript_23393/g.59227  ORF Transcript_23393/g.59227 Transcript_23393/m.59227 type:complete len:300 (-) Transcript_23393:64-963(-)
MGKRKAAAKEVIEEVEEVEEEVMEEDDEEEVDDEVEAQIENEIEEPSIAMGEELQLVKKGPKAFANSADDLLRKKKEIETGLPWAETLVVSVPKKVELERVDDDLNREAQFYDIALKGVQEGFNKLKELGVPVKRPNDYFAEMVKSDHHMQKIKAKLIHDKKEMDEKEKRKTDRKLKKFGKKVQAEVQQRRVKEKKSLIADMDKFRKQGIASDTLKADLGLESKTRSHAPKKSKKREMKDAKFGFGGKKRGMKRNSADSAADMSGFSRKSYKRVPAGIKKNSKTGGKRPGKAARQGKKR